MEREGGGHEGGVGSVLPLLNLISAIKSGLVLFRYVLVTLLSEHRAEDGREEKSEANM